MLCKNLAILCQRYVGRAEKTLEVSSRQIVVQLMRANNITGHHILTQIQIQIYSSRRKRLFHMLLPKQVDCFFFCRRRTKQLTLARKENVLGHVATRT